jgi:monofunctional biosynthetic peptidoglycan transglycosylase
MKYLSRLFLIISVIIFLLVSIFYLTLPVTSVLRSENPQITALMKQRQKEYAQAGKKYKIFQKWVRFKEIPDLLKQSVRISEDASFYFHDGVDLYELEQAVKTNLEEGYFKRGASTITQQLAKNLYLTTERSLFRKVRELFIARRLEATLSKYRIFHLYLNVIEFGPSIYGVGAASSSYFNKDISELTPEEIIRLTAVIPKPLSENPTADSKWLRWRCCWISQKLFKYGYVDSILHNELLLEFCED